MGLFSDIYNTVARFFRPQEEQGEGPSKAVAANRLKLVLMQDRTNLTPKILEQMRGELIDLLSKYLEMDKELLELNFEQEGDQVALMLSIPVIRAKDEDEIEEAIRASKMESEEEDDDESEENNEETNNVSEDIENSEEIENNETERAQEESEKEESKPKKKRSKKVSQPEEIENHTSEKDIQQENLVENIQGE